MHLRTNWKQDEQEFTGAKVDGLGERGIKENLQPFFYEFCVCEYNA